MNNQQRDEILSSENTSGPLASAIEAIYRHPEPNPDDINTDLGEPNNKKKQRLSPSPDARGQYPQYSRRSRFKELAKKCKELQKQKIVRVGLNET